MKRPLLRAAIIAGCGLTMLLTSPEGHAQSQGPVLDKIIVTAQKREEGLEDVPMVIDVVTGESLIDMGVRNLEEVSFSTPGFHVQQSPAQLGLYIRSIGSGASNQGFEQSVGLFIDGVYAGRERMFQAPFLDIERIEVIKGPQSVILGKNTTAGAISITTAKPTDEFEGYVTGLYGSNNEYAVTGVVSGPIAEGLSFRLAARTSGMTGYVHNTLSGETEPDIDDFVIRGSLLWEPNEDLSFLFKAEYGRSRQDGNALAAYLLTPGQFALARMFDPNFETDVKHRLKSTDNQGLPNNQEYNDLNAYNFTLTTEYDLSDWTLTSITAYGHLDYGQGTDADELPTPPASVSLEVNSGYEQLSQELRVASPVGKTLEVLAGGYFFTADVNYLNWIPCVSFASIPGVGLPSEFCAPAHFEQTQTAWSGFLKGTWNITDALRITAGVRYTYERKKASNELLITEFDGITPNTSPFDLLIAQVVGGWATHQIPLTRRTENNWSPSVNIQYDITPDVMIYVSFTRGQKGGGFNPLEGTGDLATWEYSHETGQSFEAGIKATLFDGQAAINIAGFLSKFSDLQVSQFNGVTFNVTNAASAKVDGIEVDFRWRATDKLTLGGNVAYLNSRYGSFPTGPCIIAQTPAQGCVGGLQDLSGEPLPFAPDWSGTFDVDFVQPIGSNLQISVHGDVFFSDKYFLGPDNDPISIQPGFAKINARIGLGDIDEMWEIAVIGKNLTNKITRAHTNDVVGFPSAYWAAIQRGRSFAVQGTLHF